MEEPFADVSEDGELLIDWDAVILLSMDFDAGHRDNETSWGKILISVQRMAFERGYAAGCLSKHPRDGLLAFTMGNA